MIQESVLLLCGRQSELTSVAAGETRLGQALLELLGIDLAVLHGIGSDIQSCVTLRGINNVLRRPVCWSSVRR